MPLISNFQLVAAAAAVFVVLAEVGPGGHYEGNWNEGVVGPSQHFEELETDTMEKKVFRTDKDVVVVIYTDRCGCCQDLHPKHEAIAASIKKQTNHIHFARVDQYRMGPPEVLFRGNLEPFLEGELPKMFFVKAGAAVVTKEIAKLRVQRIPEKGLGYPRSGVVPFLDWLKEQSGLKNQGKGGSAPVPAPVRGPAPAPAPNQAIVGAKKEATYDTKKNASDQAKKKKSKSEEIDLGMATPTSIKTGMTATVITDTALLEQECLASGLSWPHVREKAGQKGTVLEIDLSDNTAKINSDIDWMPIKSLQLRGVKDEL